MLLESYMVGEKTKYYLSEDVSKSNISVAHRTYHCLFRRLGEDIKSTISTIGTEELTERI